MRMPATTQRHTQAWHTSASAALRARTRKLLRISTATCRNRANHMHGVQSANMVHQASCTGHGCPHPLDMHTFMCLGWGMILMKHNAAEMLCMRLGPL